MGARGRGAGLGLARVGPRGAGRRRGAGRSGGRPPRDSGRAGWALRSVSALQPRASPLRRRCQRPSVRPQPAAARRLAMPNFAGTWKMRSSENFDELLKALGELARSVGACEEERPRGAPQARGVGSGTSAGGRASPGRGRGERSKATPAGAASGAREPRAPRTFAGGLAPSPTVRPRLVLDQREARSRWSPRRIGGFKFGESV